MCYASVHLFDTNSEKYIYEKKKHFKPKYKLNANLGISELPFFVLCFLNLILHCPTNNFCTVVEGTA